MQLVTSLRDISLQIRKGILPSDGSLFTRLKRCVGLSATICLLWVTATVSPGKAAPAQPYGWSDQLDLPKEYGEVIYRINPRSPRQLYIIGISHRDPGSGANAATTVRAQMEIFRIGEWLKSHRHLNLLLPEGYFAGDEACSPRLPSAVQATEYTRPEQVANSLLQVRLTAENIFVNAEMLLMEYHSFNASQVEDKEIYDAVRCSLGKLDSDKSAGTDGADAIAEIQYLQEIRTARLLQRIPAIIENAYVKGAVRERAALFTIGLNHIKDIFRYVENAGIDIASQPGSTIQPDDLNTGLNLLRTGYGITIILPHTLATNGELLQLTKIDKILLADGNYSRKMSEN